MAKIENVTLSIGPGTAPNKKKVTVKFKLRFTKDEAGRKFKYDVRLRSEDLPTDEEDAGQPSQVLKNFDFGFFGTNEAETITAQEGLMPRSEMRQILTSTLDEDSDERHLFSPELFDVVIENSDDIYAEVFLWPFISPSSVAPIKKRSATLTWTMI